MRSNPCLRSGTNQSNRQYCRCRHPGPHLSLGSHLHLGQLRMKKSNRVHLFDMHLINQKPHRCHHRDLRENLGNRQNHGLSRYQKSTQGHLEDRHLIRREQGHCLGLSPQSNPYSRRCRNHYWNWKSSPSRRFGRNQRHRRLRRCRHPYLRRNLDIHQNRSR